MADCEPGSVYVPFLNHSNWKIVKTFFLSNYSLTTLFKWMNCFPDWIIRVWYGFQTSRSIAALIVLHIQTDTPCVCSVLRTCGWAQSVRGRHYGNFWTSLGECDAISLCLSLPVSASWRLIFGTTFLFVQFELLFHVRFSIHIRTKWRKRHRPFACCGPFLIVLNVYSSPMQSIYQYIQWSNATIFVFNKIYLRFVTN